MPRLNFQLVSAARVVRLDDAGHFGEKNAMFVRTFRRTLFIVFCLVGEYVLSFLTRRLGICRHPIWRDMSQ